MHWIDPASLPEVAGTLERFVLNPHGEVDGFVMNGQTQTPILVHTPPHMEGELTRNTEAGDKLRVRGVRPRGADVLAAVAVTEESGRQIIDKGPDHDRKLAVRSERRTSRRTAGRWHHHSHRSEGGRTPHQASHTGHQDRCERRRCRKPTRSRRPSERNRKRNGRPPPHQGIEPQSQARAQA